MQCSETRFIGVEDALGTQPTEEREGSERQDQYILHVYAQLTIFFLCVTCGWLPALNRQTHSSVCNSCVVSPLPLFVTLLNNLVNN